MKRRSQLNIIAKSLTSSEQSRIFLDESKRLAVQLQSVAIGLGTYLPGWKWSLHAGPQTGKSSENHVGCIISGNMIIQDATGFEQKVEPGDAFEVTPGHDAWVIGSVPCIALDFTHINK